MTSLLSTLSSTDLKRRFASVDRDNSGGIDG
eukprot:SAG11_NODE_9594_length_897_cov_1.271930_3_plen_30_part_01